MRRVRTGATARACRAAALSAALTLSAAGCSPELRPLVAVYVDQRGSAQALLRPCDDDGRVRAPRLLGTAVRVPQEDLSDEGRGTAPETPPGEEPWIGWETRGTHEAADFPLFAPPARWGAELRGPRSPRPGYTYELAFTDPEDSYAYNASVTFDAGQLAAVPAGEVLTLRGTMPRRKFEALARKAC